MNVPILDLKPAYDELRAELDAAYHRVMESGWLLIGKELEAFEAEYAASIGVKHCVGVANGLEAMQLVLMAHGIGPGHEVIVPSHGYIATWLAVTHAGATPIPCEPDPRTYNLDPARIDELVTPRTKAILPIHLYGQTADLDGINAVAARHGLFVLEDAAQSHGARCRVRSDVAAGASGEVNTPNRWGRLSAAGLGSAPPMPLQSASSIGTQAVSEKQPHQLPEFPEPRGASGVVSRNVGSEWKAAGALGHAAGVSFYPSKNLGALADAGAVTTNDAALADKVRHLRNYGSKVRYQHEYLGLNSRMSELQAAFLRVKLPRLAEWNARRAGLAARYFEQLHGVGDLVLPFVPDWAEPVWHLFVIRTAQRDALQAHLAGRGIGTQIHYPIPPHLSKAYAPAGWKRGDLPFAEQFASKVLSLPIGPHHTAEQIDFVCLAVKEFFQK